MLLLASAFYLTAYGGISAAFIVRQQPFLAGAFAWFACATFVSATLLIVRELRLLA